MIWVFLDISRWFRGESLCCTQMQFGCWFSSGLEQPPVVTVGSVVAKPSVYRMLCSSAALRVKYCILPNVLSLAMFGMFGFTIYMFPESKYVYVFLVLIAMYASSRGGRNHVINLHLKSCCCFW